MQGLLTRQHGGCSTSGRQLLRGLHVQAPRMHATPKQLQQSHRVMHAAAAADAIAPSQPYAAPDLQTASLLLLLFESYKRAHGRPLVDGVMDLVKVPQALWGLKCCIVVLMRQPPSPLKHQTTPSDASTSSASIAYANAAARELLSAQSSSRADAHVGLEGMAATAIMPHLHPSIADQVVVELAPGVKPRAEVVRGLQLQAIGGDRISADCVLCDVASPSGALLGRAVLFESWEHADGRMGRPFVAPLPKDQVPGPVQLAAAEEAVRVQADAVRALKAGRSNKDPEVQAGVAELQARKVALSLVQEWAARPLPQYLHELAGTAEGPVAGASTEAKH